MDTNDFADKFATNAKTFVKITILCMMMMGSARFIAKKVEKKEYETVKSIIPGIDTVTVFRATPFEGGTGYTLDCITKEGKTFRFKTYPTHLKVPTPCEGDKIVVSLNNDNLLCLNHFKIHQNLTANKQAELLTKQK